MIRRIKIKFTIVMLRILFFFIYDRMAQSYSTTGIKILICDKLLIRFSLNDQDLKFNYKNIMFKMITMVNICTYMIKWT